MNFFIGDSHIRQFYMYGYGNYSISSFSGSTIKGLNRENSTVGHGKIIKTIIESHDNAKFFILLGAVDLDFTFFKALYLDENLQFETFAKSLCDSYARFLSNLSMKASSKIFVLGPHVSPLVGDKFFHFTSQIAGLDPVALRNLVERKDLGQGRRAWNTIHFNNLLQEYIQQETSANFLRIDRDMIDEKGTIEKKFIAHDHHAKASETLKLWKSKLVEHVPEITGY